MTKRSSRVRPLTDRDEAAIQRQIAADPDDADATDAELAKARPFGVAFPQLMESIRRSRGRPRVAAPKQAVTLRVSPDTLARFKASGKNWRTRMANVLDKAKT